MIHDGSAAPDCAPTIALRNSIGFPQDLAGFGIERQDTSPLHAAWISRVKGRNDLLEGGNPDVHSVAIYDGGLCDHPEGFILHLCDPKQVAGCLVNSHHTCTSAKLSTLVTEDELTACHRRGRPSIV